MLACLHDPTLGEGDIAYANGSLIEGHDLETAAYLSLFTDSPARPDDVVPAGASRRGFWGDALSTIGDVWGSRLWLLERAKAVASTLQRAREYSLEALAWMLDDGIASKVDVESSWMDLDDGEKALVLDVEIWPPNERTPRRFGPWEVLRAAA